MRWAYPAGVGRAKGRAPQPDPAPAADASPVLDDEPANATIDGLALGAGVVGALAGGGPFAAGAIVGELAALTKQPVDSVDEPADVPPSDDR